MKEFFTVAEAAVYLSMSERMIRHHIVNGHIPAGRVGQRWRIRVSDLDLALAPVNVAGGDA